MPGHKSCSPCCKEGCNFYKYPACPVYSESETKQSYRPIDISTTYINDLISGLYKRAKQKHANCCGTSCPHKFRKRLVSCKPSSFGMKCCKLPQCQQCCCKNNKCIKCHSRRVQTSVESCTVGFMCKGRKHNNSKSTCAQPSCRSFDQAESAYNSGSDKCEVKPAVKILKCLRKCSLSCPGAKKIPPPCNICVPCDPCTPCEPRVSYVPCRSLYRNASPGSADGSMATRSNKSCSRSRHKCTCHELGVQAFQSKSATNCVKDCSAPCSKSNDNIILRGLMCYCRLLSKPKIAVPIIFVMFYYIFTRINSSIMVCQF